MAFNDTLFQLGMDLTRSSTAQTEDHRFTTPAVRVARDDRNSGLPERAEHQVSGQHLIIDLSGAKRLDDIKHIERTLRRCVEVAGASLLNVHLHRTTPNSVSGIAVVSEGHISVHSWPDAGFAAFDVFVGGDADLRLCVDVLRAAFDASHVVVKSHERGSEAAPRVWPVTQPASAAPVRLRTVRKAKAA